ncbi:asparaginase [Corynebacterium breve]|uniref:asparaginase n=1 Tax=Corynebacterium breve TaxID=3049799 RepID=A0ABY8VCW6_9CORY|nr:asparaginase [Corynebacterium breve]WIM66962.1 asparaginase [Corynebacterium breve]
MASWKTMQPAGSIGKVFIIATGGTIASTQNSSGACVPTLHRAQLVERAGAHYPTTGIDSAFLDSSDMPLADIDELVVATRRALADPEIVGVVITHGTDSLADTALALDLMHSDPRPVILTGAQRPADHPAPDGPRNLRESIELAADPSARNRGVLVRFGGRTLPARGVIKRHTSDLDAFHATSPLPLSRPAPLAPVQLSSVDVVIVSAWAGASETALRAIASTRPDGVVVAAMGSGNVSTAMGHVLTGMLNDDTPVVISTQLPEGEVTFDYGGAGGGHTLGALGAIPAGYLRPHQARIALTAALAAGIDPASLF